MRYIICLLLLILSSCAWSTEGALVSLPTTPVAAGENVGTSKEGKAVCWNVLGIAAWGDCSVEAAKKAGGISKVATVDKENFGILGIVFKTTVVVKGE